ncbi:PREDICTED: Bloom syndrome protein homolog [Acropora digitifera]|uniref:Bloom syndrome protein homolog n=1 Tax=Acropora digitifera TaxID=70779 RepID=UPI00077B13AE|nr:PREDICTED: Bloom syndrome protein homolog [Acropora digitifera]
MYIIIHRIIAQSTILQIQKLNNEVRITCTIEILDHCIHLSRNRYKKYLKEPSLPKRSRKAVDVFFDLRQKTRPQLSVNVLLDPHAYDQQNKVPQNCFLGVYHSNSWDRNKERISTSLKARNGSIKRVVVATTALHMGVNFPDIRYIITWGVARSLLDFHQEAGHAGRDGLQSHVVVLYHGQQVGPCEKESLDKNINSLSPLHNCCSFCATVCKCNGHSCNAEALPFEGETSLPEEAVNRTTREVTPRDRRDLDSALKEVVTSIKMQGLSTDNTSSHGFSEQMISDVVTKRDLYPLPRCDDILESLAGAQWFSHLDLLRGYWQIDVVEEDREKTAFATPDGLYQFRKLSFGLTNAPACFMRAMHLVLKGLCWSDCLVYLDDIIVFGRTLQEHRERLSLVLSHLSEAGLKINPKKCKLLSERVIVLGHVVTRDGISTDPEKVRVIKEWRVPEDESQLKAFLGTASY